MQMVVSTQLGQKVLVAFGQTQLRIIDLITLIKLWEDARTYLDLKED